ncbi:cubilin-like isoform X2 [Artemia franciscana]|uniref:cubilin-like isoform X2 n=1 Tax=Artemia franciscana TaxID=6661 RepID=UPI0032DAD7D3
MDYLILTKLKERKGKKHRNDLIRRQNSLPPQPFQNSVYFPQYADNFIRPTPYSQCDYIVNDLEFTLMSRNFPSFYDPNVNCPYNVKQHPGMCSLQITFRAFAIEHSRECTKDWLQIGNLRYCGLLRPKPILIPFDGQGRIYINFHTDSAVNGRGFSMFARQLPCEPAPIPSGQEQKVFVEEPYRYWPNRPPRPPCWHHYCNNQRCPPHPCPTKPPTPIVSAVPLTTPTPIVTSTPLPALCEVEQNGLEGRFYSPGYPLGYAENLECTYRVKRARGHCYIYFFFSDFLLESSFECQKDFVSFGGRRYCGTQLYGITGREEFSSSGIFLLQFKSDGYGYGRGFHTFYKQILCQDPLTSTSATTQVTSPVTIPPATTLLPITCDRDFNGVENFVTSVNHPSYYLPNLQCEYTFNKFSSSILYLEVYFIFFELQVSSDCSADYLEVAGRRYCGDQTGTIFTIPFTGQFETIIFKSDSTSEYIGFSIRIRQLQNPPIPVPSTTASPNGCSTRYFNESSFVFTSPQYPSAYKPGQECRFIIQKSSKNVCEIQFKLIQFELPQTPGCVGDYLQIGYSPDRLCGEQTGKTFAFDVISDTLEVTFTADEEDEGAPGFMIQVQQVDLGCSSTIVPPSLLQGPLRSDIIPVLAEPLKAEECEKNLFDTNGHIVLNYIDANRNDHGKNCRYIFHKSKGYCGLHLHFHNFYLTPSTNCTKNFVSLEGRQFCGRQLDGSSVDVAYTYDSKEVIIPYKVNEGQKGVWNISYNQGLCDTDFQSQCSQSIWSPSGYFVFQGNASHSSGELLCDFIIRRWSKRVCKVHFHYEKFEIPGEGSCTSSYLDIVDHKMCGSLNGRKVSVRFPLDAEALRFRLKLNSTDVPDTQLRIRVKQVICR